MFKGCLGKNSENIRSTVKKQKRHKLRMPLTHDEHKQSVLIKMLLETKKTC